MRNAWRVLLLCLTMLALPLQGVAAVRMLHCLGPAPAALHEQPEAGHGHGAHHDHHGDHSDAAAHGHAASGPADVDHASGHGKAHKCSACAACCAGMAVAFALPVMPQPVHEAERTPGPQAAAASFIAGGLERPPRAWLV